MNFRLRLLASSLLLSAVLPAFAAVPPAPKLLPKDTLALVTVPDWTKATDHAKGSPGGRLWADPAMRAFREHFEKKFSAEVIDNLEKELGVKVADYVALLQGQLTLAVVQDDWKGEDNKSPGVVLVLDVRDKSDQLKAKLEEVRKKLTEAKKPVKTEKIRDLEFTTVTVNPEEAASGGDKKGADKEKDKDKDDDQKPAEKIELTFGQADSALLVGNSVKTLEKVVARLTGGTVPTVGEEPAFQASEGSLFRDTYAYGWLNFSPVYDLIVRKAKADLDSDELGVEPGAALKALGLAGLKTAAFGMRADENGTYVSASLGVPESQRLGLFKMLAVAARESGPLPFVPADAVKFQRWRLDGQKLWATLEETANAISPQLGGVLTLMTGAAGKDKDPNFDFKKAFVANLGDDLIGYGKSPKSTSADDVMNAPAIVLIGSPNAEQLITGLRALGGLLPTGGEEAKVREFNGKKVYAVKLPTAPKQSDRQLEYAASGGYVALSANPGLLEEYLRSGEGSGKSLKDDAALVAAAQPVGGLGTGLFGYENQRETLRSQWGFLRDGGFEKLMAQGGNAKADWKEWFDFSLLPAYDQVAKYFGIAVYAGSADAQGLHFRAHGPTPK